MVAKSIKPPMSLATFGPKRWFDSRITLPDSCSAAIAAFTMSRRSTRQFAESHARQVIPQGRAAAVSGRRATGCHRHGHQGSAALGAKTYRT